MNLFDEIMLFVRFGGAETAVYEFREFEDLLSAVRACRNVFRSELIYHNDRYILAITPWEGDAVPEVLGEFGCKLKLRPELMPHLREQGRQLIGENAVETLLDVFENLDNNGIITIQN